MLQLIIFSFEDGIWVNSVSDIVRPADIDLQTYQFLLCFCPQFVDGYCFSLSDIVRSNHIWRPIHFFAFISYWNFSFTDRHWKHKTYWRQTEISLKATFEQYILKTFQIFLSSSTIRYQGLAVFTQELKTGSEYICKSALGSGV